MGADTLIIRVFVYEPYDSNDCEKYRHNAAYCAYVRRGVAKPLEESRYEDEDDNGNGGDEERTSEKIAKPTVSM